MGERASVVIICSNLQLSDFSVLQLNRTKCWKHSEKLKVAVGIHISYPLSIYSTFSLLGAENSVESTRVKCNLNWFEQDFFHELELNLKHFSGVFVGPEPSCLNIYFQSLA